MHLNLLQSQLNEPRGENQLCYLEADKESSHLQTHQKKTVILDEQQQDAMQHKKSGMSTFLKERRECQKS